MSRTYRRMNPYVEDISIYFMSPTPPSHIHRDIRWTQKFFDNKLMKFSYKTKMRTERRIINSLLKKNYEFWEDLVYKKDKKMFYDAYYVAW